MPFLTDKPGRKRAPTETNKSDAQKAVKGAWGKVKGFAGKVVDDLGDFAMRAGDNAAGRPYGSSAKASEPKGTYRATGAGREGSKGDAGTAPKKSAMYAAPPKKAAVAKPAASKPAYKAKGVPDYNKDLGDIYLNATSNMFSPKAGGTKGKK